MKNKLISGKQLFIYLVSFLLPGFLYACMFAQNGIVYGGEKTLLVSDLFSQYLPNISSLRYLVNGESSIFFNWGSDLGGDYYALFAYYLASPLNLITLFWNLEQMPDAIYVLTILKICFTGLSFCIFIRFALLEKENRWSDIIFCCCYALMAYLVAFGLCIIWMDTLIVLPIVLIGAKRIANGEKSKLFVVSLLILFLVNFYMSFAAGIFVFLFFLYEWFTASEKRNPVKVILNFFLHTIISLCLSMVLVVPTVLKIYQNASVQGLSEDSLQYTEEHISLTLFLKMLLPYQYEGVGVGSFQSPYIYCGSIIIVLIILFYLSKIGWKKKIYSLILVAPAMIGFFVPFINLLWHGLQSPHGFLYRYSYLFSLGLIIIAYYSAQYYCAFLDNNKIQLIVAVIGIYTIGELLFNGIYLQEKLSEDMGYVSRETYSSLNEMYAEVNNIISVREEKNSVYRVLEDFGYVGWNTGLMYNFSGTLYFSSSYNAEFGKFLRAFGCAGAQRFTNLSGATPLMSSVFGVKYILSDLELSSPYEMIAVLKNGTYLYYNPNAYEIGIAEPYNIDSVTISYTGINPIQMNNSMSYILSGCEGYNEIPFEYVIGENNNQLCLKIPYNSIKGDRIFLYLSWLEYDNNSEYSSSIWTNGTVLREVITSGKRSILNVPVITVQDSDYYEIYITNVNTSYADSIIVFQEDPELMQAILDSLQLRQMYEVSKMKNGFTGKITSSEDCTLLFSLAYESGYRITVDGQAVDKKKLLNTFLGVSVPGGTHVVTVTYIPYGFYCGCAISVIGLVAAILFFCRQKKVK